MAIAGQKLVTLDQTLTARCRYDDASVMPRLANDLPVALRLIGLLKRNEKRKLEMDKRNDDQIPQNPSPLTDAGRRKLADYIAIIEDSQRKMMNAIQVIRYGGLYQEK